MQQDTTYGVDICFNLKKCNDHCIKDFDPIMKPVYDDWNAEWVASETGPLGGSEDEVERIIAVRRIKAENVRFLIEYMKLYPYVRLKWFTKSSPKLDDTFYFTTGELPTDATELDVFISDNFE